MTEELEAPGSEGGTTENPANNPEASSAEAGKSSVDFQIPEPFKDKPWTKNVKSVEDLFKIHDDAQALIGKKRIIPDFDKATPQEVDEYLNMLRPKEKEVFADFFKDDKEMSDERKSAFTDLLFESGLSKPQAERILKGYKAMEASVQEKLFDKDGFIESLKKNFGDEYEKKSAVINQIFQKHLSKEDQTFLDEKMPNEFLGLVYRLVDNLQKAYGITESGTPGEAGTGARPAVDVEAMRKEIRGQIAELSKRPHTIEEKQVLQDRLNATYNNGGKK